MQAALWQGAPARGETRVQLHRCRRGAWLEAATCRHRPLRPDPAPPTLLQISSDTQITKQNNIRPRSASHAAHLRDPAPPLLYIKACSLSPPSCCAHARNGSFSLLAPRSAPRPVHRPVALSIPCALTFIACISLHIGCECLPYLDARPSLIGGEHLRDRAEQFLARLGHLELGRINFGGEQLVELLSHAEQQPLLLHGD